MGDLVICNYCHETDHDTSQCQMYQLFAFQQQAASRPNLAQQLYQNLSAQQIYNAGGLGGGFSGNYGVLGSGGGGMSGLGTKGSVGLGPILQYAINLHNPGVPLKNEGVQVGEIVGWRIWRIDSGFLRSYSYDTSWFPNEPMAGEPEDYNSAGVWALKTAHLALNKCLSEGGKYAVGSVWMWGDIVEHSQGYRSQYAMVRGIDFVPNDDKELLAQLRERYGVSDSHGVSPNENFL